MLRPPNLITRFENANADQIKAVKKFNDAIQSLDGLRAVEIAVSGRFARSKIAWKLATYQHSLLHRIVALYDGAALSWNSSSTLSALLAARALLETNAIFLNFADKTESMLKFGDLEGLNSSAQYGIFASRDSEWLKNAPEYQATNILKHIDYIDKRVKGARSHYDRLSERCHPNMMGHHYMFGTLDRTDGTVRFKDERDPTGNLLLLLGGVSLVPLIERRTVELDALIEQVADLQHDKQPVGSAD